MTDNGAMKILAIDFGMKRIGFAVGNTLINTATPLDPVARKNSKQVIQHIKTLLDDYDIQRIVMGYPLNMDGSKSVITEQVEHFTRRLQKAAGPGIDVAWTDERLSSVEARQDMDHIKPGLKKRKAVIDSMSAMVILRRYMETT